jgi:hypothetical protein
VSERLGSVDRGPSNGVRRGEPLSFAVEWPRIRSDMGTVSAKADNVFDGGDCT